MTVNVNGWSSIGDTDKIAVLTAGVDNIPSPADYLQMVPTENNQRVVGWLAPDGPPECQWIMEVANADPTQTMDILLIGGAPAQDPPQILLPPGYTSVTLKPGFAQRLYYKTGIGWVPLFAGTLTP